MRLSFITPVVNTWIITELWGHTWKILVPTDQHHVTTKTEQALPYPICLLKGIQCKLRSLSTQGWLMPYVRLMLKIHKGWYTWFITPEMFCQSNSWNLGTRFTTQLCSLLQVTASSTIAALLSFYLLCNAGTQKWLQLTKSPVSKTEGFLEKNVWCSRIKRWRN